MARRIPLVTAGVLRVLEPPGGPRISKERRSGGAEYWTAYRKRGGKLRKVYLGKVEKLTLARLEDAATKLASRGEGKVTTADDTGPTRANGAGREVLTRSDDQALESAHPGLQGDPLLLTKLSVPSSRRSFVTRLRLSEQLEEELGGKLTLMSAPAGFGKTTLLSMWLAVSSRSGRSAVWLQQARGEYDSAKTTLETFSHLVHERNFFAPLLGHAGAAKARLALTQGNLPGAIAWVDANGLNIDEPSFPCELEYLTLIRVLIARGRGDPEGPYFGHALRLIDRLLEAAESGARMEPRKGSPHLRGGSAAVPRMLELTAHDLGRHFGLDKQCLLMEVRPGRL